MRFLLDVNALIALSVTSHVHYERVEGFVIRQRRLAARGRARGVILPKSIATGQADQ